MLGIQDGGSKFNMAALRRHCDVMKRHNPHIIIIQSVKLMTYYKRAKFHHKSVNPFRDLWGGHKVPPRLRNSKKAQAK